MLHLRKGIIEVMQEFFPLLISLGPTKAPGVIFAMLPPHKQKISSGVLKTGSNFDSEKSGGWPQLAAVPWPWWRRKPHPGRCGHSKALLLISLRSSRTCWNQRIGLSGFHRQALTDEWFIDLLWQVCFEVARETHLSCYAET